MPFESISKEFAKELITSYKDNDCLVVLDVRTPHEFASGALPRAVNLNFYSPDFADKLNELDRSKVYLVYCRSGNRSKVVMNMMRQLGFGWVYEIDEGIEG